MACCSMARSRRTASGSSFAGRRLSGSFGGWESKVLLPCSTGTICSVFLAGAAMFASTYEFVAHSVHGQKKTGLLRDRFELLPNPYNVRVDGTGGGKVFVSPDLVEQPVAAHGLAGMTEKMLFQPKLRP